MTNTTTPAESVSALSAAAAYYRWEIPDKPVVIHVSLELVARLERAAIESFKAVTKRGSEIGGVLAGRIVPGGKRTIYVEQFEPVECDYSRGPLFMLSDDDKGRLKQAMDRIKAGPLSVAGYFRSNTRSNLLLDEEDLATAREFFSDPNHVFLLVRPFSMKPSLGGFFFWEDGSIHAEATYQSFPFRSEELLKNFAQLIGPGPGKAAETSPAREPLVMPKREERPMVSTTLSYKREEPVPPVMKREPPPAPPVIRREEPKPTLVPPRREEAAPLPAMKREEPRPVLPPKREEPASLKREESPAAPSKREEPRREDRFSGPLGLNRPPATPSAPKRDDRSAGPATVTKEPPAPAVTAKREERPATVVAPKREDKPAVTLRRDEKPAAAPIVKREEPAPVKVEEKPVVVVKQPEPPARKEEPAPKITAEEPRIATAEVTQTVVEVQPGVFARFKFVILAVVLLAAIGGYFMFRSKTATAPATPVDTALGLKVERNAGQLVLSWNRNASLLATATRAILTITDGDHKEDVELDLGQLRSGSIVYSAITNDVSFRLEVTDLKNGKSLSESQRFLAGRPSPTVAATQPAAVQPAPGTPDTAAGKPAASIPSAPPSQVQAASAAAPEPAPAAVEQPKVSAGPAVTAQPPKPESLAARLRAPEPQEIPAPPSIDTGTAALPARAGMPLQTSVAAAPPPVAPAQQPPAPAAQQPTPQAPPSAAATQAPAQPAVRTGGRAQEARLLRRVSPVYPSLARQTRVSGIVRIQAQIDKNGKVKKATAISGPPLLRQAAVDAVMRWGYSPAILNGEPVDTETFIDVNFQL